MYKEILNNNNNNNNNNARGSPLVQEKYQEEKACDKRHPYLIIITIIRMSLVTSLFFLVLLLNQRWSQPLRLQASHCNTFLIMSDVPSRAVFCSESIECFPGTVSKFFLKFLFTIPMAPIITHIIVLHKLLYFNFFSASFCTTFLSAGIATSISVHVFSFLFLIIISGLFAVTSLSVCTAWFHNTVTSPSSHTGFGMCVYHLSVVSLPKALYIE